MYWRGFFYWFCFLTEQNWHDCLTIILVSSSLLPPSRYTVYTHCTCNISQCAYMYTSICTFIKVCNIYINIQYMHMYELVLGLHNTYLSLCLYAVKSWHVAVFLSQVSGRRGRYHQTSLSHWICCHSDSGIYALIYQVQKCIHSTESLSSHSIDSMLLVYSLYRQLLMNLIIVLRTLLLISEMDSD